MKERSYSEFIRVFKGLHDHLLTRGLKPAYMRLDKEASHAFQRDIKSKDIYLRLAPPGMNFRIVEEHSMIILKDHFISGIFLTYL